MKNSVSRQCCDQHLLPCQCDQCGDIRKRYWSVPMHRVHVAPLNLFLRCLLPCLLAERECVSVSNFASTMITLMVGNPLIPVLDLTALRLVSCGGSPQSPITIYKAIAAFGCEFFVSWLHLCSASSWHDVQLA